MIEIAAHFSWLVGVGAKGDGHSCLAQAAEDVQGGIGFTHRPVQPGGVDLHQDTGSRHPVGQAVELDIQGPGGPIAELLDQVQVAQDGEEPGFGCIPDQLEILDPHVVDLTLRVPVHLAGIVEAPGAQMVDAPDHVVERMAVEEGADLRDGMRTVVGFDAEEDEVGEACLESLHLGHVVAQLAGMHGQFGGALG